MQKKILRPLLLIVSGLLLAVEVWARAGGAGGGHSGGGGGGGGGHSYGGGGGGSDGQGTGALFYLFIFLVQRPWGWGVLLLCAFLVLRFARKVSDNVQEDQAQEDQAHESALIVKQSIPLDPEQLMDVRRKAQTAFDIIQSAWSQKKTSLMRRFITDGVYQRFNAQFTMMNLLDQTNIISNVAVTRVDAVRYSIDGDYECLDIEIRAEADDQFISHRFPQFNSPGGREPFTEYWSFIRRHDSAKKADIFNHNDCPKCGGSLTEKLMETARCPYCGVYINSGEFDWVLSEITQAESYGHSRFASMVAPELPQQVAMIKTQEPHFSRQVLEDRASNAFLQVLIGMATKNLQSVQRFSMPEFFQKAQQLLSSQDFIYDRLFVKSVDLLELIPLENNFIQANVAVDYSFQRVQLQGDRAVAIDADMVDRHCILILMHQVSAQVSKGSIYANACPQCGGTQKDSLNAVCEYCGSNLNDPRGDWIVADMDFK